VATEKTSRTLSLSPPSKLSLDVAERERERGREREREREREKERERERENTMCPGMVEWTLSVRTESVIVAFHSFGGC
jgi:hypothetical protein